MNFDYLNIFPQPLFLAVANGPREERLHPEEEAFIAKAVEQRRIEFTTVRQCARQVLAELGHDRPPLLADSVLGLPWPSGTTGSLTHSHGFCAAAAASTATYRGIGIDTEAMAALPEGLDERVLLPDELDHIRALASGAPRIPWDTVIFSAKESIYKTWAPLASEFLDFDQATVRLSPEPHGTASRGTFEAVLFASSPLAPSCIQGAWLVAHGRIHTAAWALA